jgi:hypothetical protein
MADGSQGMLCSVCGQPLMSGQSTCPACGASGRWQELVRAAQFAQGRFEQWAKEGTIGGGPAKAIAADCARQVDGFRRTARAGGPVPDEAATLFGDTCWNCRTPTFTKQQRCPGCGVPVNQPTVELLQFCAYTSHQIKAQCDAGRLPLAQAHACMNDTTSRMAALRSRLEKDRVSVGVVTAEVVPEEPVEATVVSGSPTDAARLPRRPLWEIILDPRTIQWLLGLGGVLLVLGLVIWLATLGIFKEPLVVAVALGLGNAAVLAGGWATIRLTRYQTAGRAITLLACLVMPLNLWFYHANGLVTLEGHLWVAALVCCVLYLASALVLRDPLFVYVLCGGIAMTGLLMLVDAGRFWEIASPAALLVVLGLIAIHAERAFPEIEGPFSRRRFGQAFFLSGHVLMAAGLLLILGAQLAGDWLYRPVFQPLYERWHLGPPAIVAERWGQLLALGMILAASYAYFYSDMVVRRVGFYVYLAVFTLLWAEMLVIELLAMRVTTEAAIVALALTGLAANLLQPQLLRWRKPLADGETGEGLATTALSLVRAGQPLGLFLSTAPVLLGLVLHLRATYRPLNHAWCLPDGQLYGITWTYVVAMLITAISCRIGAHLYRHSIRWLSATYFFGTAAATLLGLVGLLSVLGIRDWDELAPLVMLVPILYLIASRLYRGGSQEQPLVWVAHAATGVMIVAVLGAAMHLTPAHVVEPVAGKSANLLLAAFFAEAALFYALAAAFHKQGLNVYLGTLMACGAAWQLLQYTQVGAEYYTLTFALLGLALLVGYRLAMLEWTGLVGPAFQSANALLSLSLVAAALLTLSRLATHPSTVHWSLLFLLLALTAISLLAAWLVREAAHRRWYIVMAIVEAALTFLTLHVLIHLTLWEKLEIFSIAAGVSLLVIGHVGWHREQDRHDDLITFSLLYGSLLVGLPLTIAVLIHRCQPVPEFSTPNELGMLVAGIALLTTGFICQLRSTTITGAVLLLVYLLSLVLFINILENVQTAAIWLTVGGGVIFGTGLLLSIYRDRLLTLPERVARREGVFRVLGWR